MKSILVTLVALTTAIAAHAQQLDTRWSSWLGCWQLTGEPVRVCAAPSVDNAGVTLTTTVQNTADPVLAQTLVADGTRRPVAEADCTGWQQAEWSRTGERLFARAELTCRDGGVRTVTGVSMILGNGTWIDVQGVEIGGRENIRVRRYRRADAPRTGVAPRLATPFTVADVSEASAKLSAQVLEAALVETNAGFDLSSRSLLELDRAGVADRVIDMMVALSYPRAFVVDRPSPLPLNDPAFDITNTWFASWPFPYYGDYWSRSYWYSPFYYSPFGYAFWATYGGYYPFGSFLPGGGIIPSGGSAEAGDGRAVKGVGYTRIRTRAEVEAEAAGTRRTSDGANVTPPSSRGDASSGSSSAGVSSSGFSSGSSSTDTGRTAQPR